MGYGCVHESILEVAVDCSHHGDLVRLQTLFVVTVAGAGISCGPEEVQFLCVNSQRQLYGDVAEVGRRAGFRYQFFGVGVRGPPSLPL